MTATPDVIEREKIEDEVMAQEPNMFRVLLHNDDKTTVEFVIELLQTVFHKEIAEAAKITLLVHEEGCGCAGIYTQEIAEEKTTESIILARSSGYPLQVTYEKI